MRMAGWYLKIGHDCQTLICAPYMIIFLISAFIITAVETLNNQRIIRSILKRGNFAMIIHLITPSPIPNDGSRIIAPIDTVF